MKVSDNIRQQSEDKSGNSELKKMILQLFPTLKHISSVYVISCKSSAPNIKSESFTTKYQKSNSRER